MYDAFRNAFVNLNFELTKLFFFKVIGTAFVGSGTLTSYTPTLKELRLGNRFTLESLPAGALIHSVSIKDSIIKFIRAAGTAAIVMQRVEGGCKIKLPSGQIIVLPLHSSAVLGVVSNSEHSRVVLGKAGRNRLLGIRPSVRGIAMNPVDHPHGGRTNGGRPSCTPWGIPTKGYPTVSKKKK
jgi:large subunit ribosomal protein L2